jgi:hypothetical protein
MIVRRAAVTCGRMAALVTLLSLPLSAHVTIRPPGPHAPSGYATVSLAVPNERHVDTVRIVLDVPDAFLEAGGRLSRVEYPPTWRVTIEKADIPDEIFKEENTARRARSAARNAGADHSATDGDASRQEEEAAMERLRRQWIKRVTFEGGSIPPEGFAEFHLSLQLPPTAGRYRFPATQVYADGKEVGWTQLVDGADRPAPTLIVEAPASPWTGYLSTGLSALALIASLAAFVAARRRRG